jgi:very-short-patch-repair endonuclease
MIEAQWQSKGYAKELRRSQTKAEKKLWSGLRNKRLGGYRFRRQHPIENYIADFACLKSKFIIELDGPTHESKDQQAYDVKRTESLNSKGWTVVRYANDAVFDNLAEVLHDIALHLNLLK